MLDTDTKRRIDTARDILVGKVPDPKSQVEQITIALIYKFMDDLDAESEELGGKRSFFAGDFARYGWSKLMRSGLGGHEMLALYAEAIVRMPENPGIPPLFRTIFNNAYLPYRDPETLRAFLKIIDEFAYDHSERLGDAYEYLLSVLGSQGDAGQFRTPRHIIDFIVAVVDPKKDETVLDPACGTAGFLISSYKHILAANTDADGNSTLTPDERGRLAANFKGYDISPDMVRLSLVNLYLHEFVDPQIVEYDTLTSDERWNEYADVILANPPFMSPKGGIRPHNRFSVQSKRSEVLFVDYMAEHLTASGRAGFIVPEGIIFQSQNAYKQLRKLLVEEYLVAVVSLPAGIFNPYSGVKTSILFLDRTLANKTDRIAFFKVENDGFDLGAQRRTIDRDDLPQVQAELAELLRCLRQGELIEDIRLTSGTVVRKEMISASGDYSLISERYRQQSRLSQTQWQTAALGDICSFLTGGTPKSTNARYYENGTVPWLVSGDIHKVQIRDCERRINELGVENSNARYLPRDSVLIALNGQGKTRGTVAMLRMAGATCNQSLVAISPLNVQDAMSDYVFLVLRSMYSDIRALTGDNQRSGLNIPILKSIQIPLPPLEVQQEIVAEIEGYQKVIDGARAVIDNYRPHIPIDPDWPLVELGKVCNFKRGPFGGSLKKEIFVRDGYAVYEQSHAISGEFSSFRYFITEKKYREMRGFEVHPRDIIMSCSGTMGRTAIVPDYAPPGIINQALLRLGTSDRILAPFLKLWMDSSNFQRSIEEITFGAAIRNVASVKVLKSLKIPLPSLESQQAIVAEIRAEQALVNANRELIKRMDDKIESSIAHVWGNP